MAFAYFPHNALSMFANYQNFEVFQNYQNQMSGFVSPIPQPYSEFIQWNQYFQN